MSFTSESQPFNDKICRLKTYWRAVLQKSEQQFGNWTMITAYISRLEEKNCR